MEVAGASDDPPDRTVARMSYVPKPLHHESFEYGELPMSGGAVPSITVHALPQNKRPVGFAPWPKRKRKKKRT